MLEGSEPVDDPTLPTRLLRVRDANGAHYVAKLHRSRERFERECHAYVNWTMALGDRAPALVAADPVSQAILLTSLPGQPADAQAVALRDEEAVHRNAGVLLRRLHEAVPATLNDRLGSELADRLEVWIRRAGGLLGERERGLLTRHARALGTLGPLETAVCHLDFQPRNWIVRHGVVHLVDFEHTRLDARVRDLTRLAYRHWLDHSNLRAAFLGGYGQGLNTIETRLLDHCGAIEAITSLVRGHEIGNPSLTAHGERVLNLLV